jgi:seryl-tRNA synthetase
MLQLNYIRENKDEVIKRLAIKNLIDADVTINTLIDKDNERKRIKKEGDDTRGELNAITDTIRDLVKAGRKDEIANEKEKTTKLKLKLEMLDEAFKLIDSDIYETLIRLPNIAHESVPKGKTPEDNDIIYEYGEKPTLYDGAKPHWDLTTKYNLIDFELGVKIAGAGFPVYKDKGAKLQRALINYFLDKATENGYIEVQPPIVVNEQSGFGTGQLPDKEGQMYHIGEDKLYLIPTAEVPITNIYRDVILNEDELPIKNCGYTPCFRREAGSYGKDVRGLNRLHQFDKVEIVQVVKPENSYLALEEMREYVAQLLRELELPFRTLKLCGGDMSFASALTYDMEVWSAAQEKWLEVSSVSNFETFQTNRLKCRYRTTDGNKLPHTLNGSALALPRIVAAILENNQTEAGIKVPKVLIPYTRFELIN